MNSRKVLVVSGMFVGSMIGENGETSSVGTHILSPSSVGALRAFNFRRGPKNGAGKGETMPLVATDQERKEKKKSRKKQKKKPMNKEKKQKGEQKVKNGKTISDRLSNNGITVAAITGSAVGVSAAAITAAAAGAAAVLAAPVVAGLVTGGGMIVVKDKLDKMKSDNEIGRLLASWVVEEYEIKEKIRIASPKGTAAKMPVNEMQQASAVKIQAIARGHIARNPFNAFIMQKRKELKDAPATREQRVKLPKEWETYKGVLEDLYKEVLGKPDRWTPVTTRVLREFQRRLKEQAQKSNKERAGRKTKRSGSAELSVLLDLAKLHVYQHDDRPARVGLDLRGLGSSLRAGSARFVTRW